MSAKTYRPYVRHHWLAHGPNNKHATCFVCGIGERAWEKRIENDSMLNWDCAAVRERDQPKTKKI